MSQTSRPHPCGPRDERPHTFQMWFAFGVLGVAANILKYFTLGQP